MSESILTSAKDILGLLEGDTSFDSELVIHINSVLATLNQLGVGPREALEIEDKTATWDDLLVDSSDPMNSASVNNPNLNAVKQYIPLKVKLVFDTPTSPHAINALEKVIAEHEHRLIMAADPYIPQSPVEPLAALEDLEEHIHSL